MERHHLQLVRRLFEALRGLDELVFDLRWTWNHSADELWARLDPVLWQATQNAWLVLQTASRARLEQLADDAEFVALLNEQVARRSAALDRTSWFEQQNPATHMAGVAYFCMEFGLSEALPLYSGGLGVLAGDMLKSASDLGVPLFGVGLLYQSGYFRQVLDGRGRQKALYPYNNPMLLPVIPALDSSGEWMHVTAARNDAAQDAHVSRLRWLRRHSHLYRARRTASPKSCRLRKLSLTPK